MKDGHSSEASGQKWGGSWTGGQYSIYRGLFGLYLLVHLGALLPYATELFSNQGVLPNGQDSPILSALPTLFAINDSPGFVIGAIIVGFIAALGFAIGKFDRICALLLYILWASLFGRNPLIANPSIPYVGWLLLAHLFIAPKPYMSLEARDRLDPGGGWRMSGAIFALAWFLMAAGYSFSGYTKLISPSWADGTALIRVLENPLAHHNALGSALLALPDVFLRLGSYCVLGLELLFLPIAAVPRLRRWVWLAAVLMHVGILLTVDFADLTFGMLVLHMFTFDPKWLARDTSIATEHVFYDGHCGLCHGAVRFSLAEDPGGTLFRYGALQGATFEDMTTEAQRSSLPDSVIVRTADGKWLEKSDAIFHMLDRYGGMWRVVAIVGRRIPLRNSAYDFIARVRHKVFAKPAEACPILPKNLRALFVP